MSRTARLLLVSMSFMPSVVMAATGGPDLVGYRWCDSDEPGVTAAVPAMVPADLRSLGFTGDEALIRIDLPASVFPTGFCFYGASYTGIWLSSNGWLSLADPFVATHPTASPLPNATPPNATVAFLWEDLTLDGTVRLAVDLGPSPLPDSFCYQIVGVSCGGDLEGPY